MSGGRVTRRARHPSAPFLTGSTSSVATPGRVKIKGRGEIDPLRVAREITQMQRIPRSVQIVTGDRLAWHSTLRQQLSVQVLDSHPIRRIAKALARPGCIASHIGAYTFMW